MPITMKEVESRKSIMLAAQVLLGKVEISDEAKKLTGTRLLDWLVETASGVVELPMQNAQTEGAP